MDSVSSDWDGRFYTDVSFLHELCECYIVLLQSHTGVQNQGFQWISNKLYWLHWQKSRFVANEILWKAEHN